MAETDDLVQATSGLHIEEKGPAGVDVPSSLTGPSSSSIGNYQISDITDVFRNNASFLPIGELVHDELFDLFECVGAIEIMDPKMDSGYLAPGESPEDEYDVLRDLLPEEVVGIMDQLLCQEMAWHSGYPLSQTLFTSHYIDKILWPQPKSIDQAQFYRGGEPPETSNLLHVVLRPYCLAVILSCNYVIQRISTSHYYEEEDFSTWKFDSEMLSNIDGAGVEVLDLLDYAIDWLYRYSTSSTPISIDPTDAEGGMLEVLKDDMVKLSRIRDALICRLEFRKHWLIFAASPPTDLGTDDDWEKVHELLKAISTTHGLGLPILDSFSVTIQRRLASTTPPRPVINLRFEDAMTMMNTLWTDCREATRLDVIPLDSPRNLQNFLWAFSSREPEPLTFARAYLQSIMFQRISGGAEDLQPGFAQLLLKDLEETVFAAHPTIDPRNWTIDRPMHLIPTNDPQTVMADAIDSFVQKAMNVGGYADFYSTLCQNRCRLRRRLCHIMVNFSKLMPEVIALDKDIVAVCPGYRICGLEMWCAHMRWRAAEWMIQLGFEQEIYRPDEVDSMYLWMMMAAHKNMDLLSILATDVDTRKAVVERKEKDQARRSQKVDSLNGNAIFVKSLSYEVHIKGAVALSLASLYSLLRQLRKLPTPDRPNMPPGLSSELRNKPLLNSEQFEPDEYEKHASLCRGVGLAILSDEMRRAYMGGASVQGDVQQATKECRELRDILGHKKLEKRAKKKKNPDTKVHKDKYPGAKPLKCVGIEATWEANLLACMETCKEVENTLRFVYDACAKGKVSDMKVTITEPHENKLRWCILPKVELETIEG